MVFMQLVRIILKKERIEWHFNKPDSNIKKEAITKNEIIKLAFKIFKGLVIIIIYLNNKCIKNSIYY